MFDWNDEELSNIIWGEAGESDDHIVPYPTGSEEKYPGLYEDHINKQWNQKVEQKKPVAITDLQGGKLEINSLYDTNEGFPATGNGVDAWPDLSLSNAAKTAQNSMDESAGLDNGSGEESDFVDYGWANIGSFDDLDRMFCNDDAMFGCVSIGNADEIWSSSKDVTSPEKFISLSLDSSSLGIAALRNTSKHSDTKTEDMLDQNLPVFPGHEKMNDFSSHAPHNVQAGMDHREYGGGKSKHLAKEKTALEIVWETPAFNSHLDAGTVANPNGFTNKVNRQRKLSRSREKSEENSEVRPSPALGGTWPPSGNQFQQIDGQYAPQMGQTSPSPVHRHRMLLHPPESLQYKHFSNTLLAPSVYYGNMGNQYPAVPVSPQFHSSEGNHQQVPSGYEVSPGNSNPLSKLSNVPMKPLSMTPQEKIEKLRRRQQMRAMLAIQKQQQQFSHKVSYAEHSISRKCSHENQMQLVEGGSTEVDENLSTLPSHDPNSPIEQDDSNTVSMAISNCSVEDTILSQLQDIIAKLDIQIRLCIRDSLFRLAQSAMQRKYAIDTSSTNKSSRDELEVLKIEEINSHNRFARLPDVETQTNPIDRTVAHLLFHRAPELLGKLADTLEATVSTNLACDRKPTGLISLPKAFLSESCNDMQTLSHQGSKIICLFSGGNPSKSSLCVDYSENASNDEAANDEAIRRLKPLDGD